MGLGLRSQVGAEDESVGIKFVFTLGVLEAVSMGEISVR